MIPFAISASTPINIITSSNGKVSHAMLKLTVLFTNKLHEILSQDYKPFYLVYQAVIDNDDGIIYTIYQKFIQQNVEWNRSFIFIRSKKKWVKICPTLDFEIHKTL